MARTRSLYGVHPGVLATQRCIATLEETTGRSLDEWIKLVKAKGPKDEAGRGEWLKKSHGLGTIQAWWIAERSFGKGLEDADPKLYLKAAEGYVEGCSPERKPGCGRSTPPS